MGGPQASRGYLGSVWGGFSEQQRVEARDGVEAVGEILVSYEVGQGQGKSLETDALWGWGWADGRCRSDLEGISKIIYPNHLFYTRKLRPKEAKGLAQGHTRG